MADDEAVKRWLLDGVDPDEKMSIEPSNSSIRNLNINVSLNAKHLDAKLPVLGGESVRDVLSRLK